MMKSIEELKGLLCIVSAKEGSGFSELQNKPKSKIVIVLRIREIRVQSRASRLDGNCKERKVSNQILLGTQSLNTVAPSNSLGPEMHHKDEKEAIDEHAEIGGQRIGELEKAERFRKEDQDGGTDDRATEVAQTANDDHGQHENALVQAGGGWV